MADANPGLRVVPYFPAAFRHIGSNDTRVTIALVELDFDGIIILNQTQWSKISKLRVHSFRGPGIYMRTGPSGET